MKKTRPPFPYVEVEWDDAVLDSGDHEVAHAATVTLSKRITRGWLIDTTDTRMIVASTCDPPETPDGVWVYSGAWTIPTGWAKVKHLQTQPRTKKKGAS